jgi:hypothetical protein
MLVRRSGGRGKGEEGVARSRCVAWWILHLLVHTSCVSGPPVPPWRCHQPTRPGPTSPHRKPCPCSCSTWRQLGSSRRSRSTASRNQQSRGRPRMTQRWSRYTGGRGGGRRRRCSCRRLPAAAVTVGAAAMGRQSVSRHQVVATRWPRHDDGQGCSLLPGLPARQQPRGPLPSRRRENLFEDLAVWRNASLTKKHLQVFKERHREDDLNRWAAGQAAVRGVFAGTAPGGGAHCKRPGQGQHRRTAPCCCAQLARLGGPRVAPGACEGARPGGGCLGGWACLPSPRSCAAQSWCLHSWRGICWRRMQQLMRSACKGQRSSAAQGLDLGPGEARGSPPLQQLRCCLLPAACCLHSPGG